MKARLLLRSSGIAENLTGLLLLALAGSLMDSSYGGNFYAGTTPLNVPWTNGIVPYEFTNFLNSAQQETYLDGLREWELAANVKFVLHTNQARWILFTFNSNNFDNVSVGYNPQIVSVSSLSRSQVGHEMGHSFGLTHENIRPDQSNFLTVLSNNVSPGNLSSFQIDPTSVTNGNYDFESVMHLGWDFASVQPGVLATQQPLPPFFRRYQYRMGNYALSPGDRAGLAYLYGPPVVPPTNIVTTTADAGPGSLRAAMYCVSDHPGTPVRFNIPASDPGYSNGVYTIHLTGHLPSLAADGMVIDGSTQPGFTGQPLIVVDASLILAETFTSDTFLVYSANNRIKNLSFQGFNWNGITLLYEDATNNSIAGCWIGLDSTGSNAAPNVKQGLFIDAGASRNIIGGSNALARNVLSGNREYGIWISGSNTMGNVILGNYIGTDPGGVFAVSNAAGGIILTEGAHGNTIGATNAAARNVISGNSDAGLWITGEGVANNTVQGNWIGLNATGAAAVANTFAGIYILDGAQSNLVANNVISGNFSEGLRLAGGGVMANSVQGNFIGTDATGSNAVPNGFLGLSLYDGAVSNIIGGVTSAARNIISGNNAEGLRIQGLGATGNLIQGNFIGTDSLGMNPLPNNFAGLTIFSGATSNTIGGTIPGARNIISGNGSDGLVLADAGSEGNVIQGNYIGTDATGSSALANGADGIYLHDGASGNVVGLAIDGSGAGNRIAFNGLTGVSVGSNDNVATLGNTIRGNTIYSNGLIGINLVGGTEDSNGVIANDVDDLDTGANNLQNYPEITNAFSNGSSTITSGILNSSASKTFVIDMYRNSSPDPSGYGEGQIYVGSVAVSTSGSGSTVFSLTASGNFSGQYFSATATDQTTGDTSEFGLDVLATNGPTAPLFVAPMSLTSSGFTAIISLTIGQTYRVQAATNLGGSPVSWTDLTNFVSGATNIVFLDRAATNFPRRFYRVVSP